MSTSGDGGGYGRPPKHTQFKPGVSGNPSGRPKTAPVLADELHLELNEQIDVQEGSSSVRISKQRAIVRALVAKALNGDMRAITLALSLGERLSSPDPSASPVSANEQAILLDYIRREARRLADNNPNRDVQDIESPDETDQR